MKALDKYVKKAGKSHPYGESKTKGAWKGPKGVTEKGQYAEKSGKKVMDDSKDYDETDPADAGIGAYESVRGYKSKKGKTKSYMDC